MDRIDRLLKEVRSKLSYDDRLERDNPYMEKSFDELLDMMCPETPGGYCAPPRKTLEWNKFSYALMHVEGSGGLKE